jgi:enolase-phosphatase E1
VRSYLEATLPTDPDVAATVAALRTEHDVDAAGGQAPPEWRDEAAGARLASAVAYVLWQMDRDRKSGALKKLQGKICEQGYLSGELRGHVYADVRPAFGRWTAAGIGVGIFSSGSVLAQKLLFAHSTAGDLTRFLQWHFDTAVGAKGEAGSYRRISDAIGAPASSILFVSDVATELDAARSAGLQTLICVRPPAQPSDGLQHRVIRTFDEIAV